MTEALRCMACSSAFEPSLSRYRCDCGGLLEVHETKPMVDADTPARFDRRLGSTAPLDRSGVWRFREGLIGVNEAHVVTHPEGGTGLYHRTAISGFVGLERVFLKHEGENPTGSFKDRGMTVAVTKAKQLGASVIACASTGNTSASLAAYAANAGLKAVVFIPSGQVATGKIAQALGYGATCLSIQGDFDVAMSLVQDAASRFGLYLVNSVNPYRLEGQKTIMWEMLQDLAWQEPDWVLVPGGNLGNTSAFGKALLEAKAAGWITKLPRIATIQAAGANPFYQSFKTNFKETFQVQAQTVATAVRIGNPVNHSKACRVIEATGGLVEQVTDHEILEAKKIIDRAGIGCEPASACSLAGLRKLVGAGVISRQDKVVCILTGHMLKDPEAILKTHPTGIINVEPRLDQVEKYL